MLSRSSQHRLSSGRCGARRNGHGGQVTQRQVGSPEVRACRGAATGRWCTSRGPARASADAARRSRSQWPTTPTRSTGSVRTAARVGTDTHASTGCAPPPRRTWMGGRRIIFAPWRRPPRCPAGSYDVNLRWAERAVAVSSADEADVLALGRQFDQPGVQRWYEDRLAVLVPRTGDLLGQPTATVTTRVDSRTCPMRAIASAPQEDRVCRDPGGPWVSASIHESLRWRSQRELLLDPLGCDVCGAAPPLGQGGPIAVFPQQVASRYGPARAAS